MSRRARIGAGLLAALVLLAAGAAAQARKPPAVASLTLYAGTDEGLWRSITWGTSWERVQLHGIETLGAARAVLAIGPWVYVAGDGGLFVSEDFGDNWTRLYAAGPALCVLPSRYPQSDPTLFLGTEAGLLRSRDAGRSFEKTSLDGTPVTRLEWPGPALVAATGRGVLVTEDAGDHVQQGGGGLPPGEVQALALSSFYAIDPVLFASVAGQGLFRSADGGKTFQPAGLAGRNVTDLAWLGPMLYAVADGRLLRSEDSGLNWSPLGEAGDAKARRLLLPLAPDNGAEMFLGTDRGAYWSGDGGLSWTASGLAGKSVLCLATFPPPAPAKKGKK